VKTPKVRLYIRIRLDGRDAFVDPVWNRNRTLRECYALIDGRLEHHPEGVYYLRFLRNGKRVWNTVGSDVDAATVALRNTEHDLQAIALGRSESGSTIDSASAVQPEAVVSLEDAIQSYLEEVRRFRLFEDHLHLRKHAGALQRCFSREGHWGGLAQGSARSYGCSPGEWSRRPHDLQPHKLDQYAAEGERCRQPAQGGGHRTSLLWSGARSEVRRYDRSAMAGVYREVRDV
jgi:hypothetical protein